MQDFKARLIQTRDQMTMCYVIYVSCGDELTVIQHQIPYLVIWSTNPALIYPLSVAKH